jgi:hypothetical protein
VPRQRGTAFGASRSFHYLTFNEVLQVLPPGSRAALNDIVDCFDFHHGPGLSVSP